MIGVPPAGAQRLVNWGVSAGKGHQIPFALLDSPVLGSLAEATAGTLTLLVGGPADVLDRCGLVLSPLGEVRHVGALGSGAAAKLVANFALLGSVTLLGEALALADALGIDRDAAWDLLETTPLAAQAGRRRPAIEDGSYPPRFPLRRDVARRDVLADHIEDRRLLGWVDAAVVLLDEPAPQVEQFRLVGGERAEGADKPAIVHPVDLALGLVPVLLGQAAQVAVEVLPGHRHVAAFAHERGGEARGGQLSDQRRERRMAGMAAGAASAHERGPQMTGRLDYDDLASDYARHRRPYPGLIEHMVSHARIGAASRVLEVGCGTANHLAGIRQATGADCVGIDPSEGMLAKAAAHGARLDLRVGHAEDLGFPPASFDVVFSVDVIHHVRQPARYFRTAFEVLKPGGKLCTATDSEWVIHNRVPLARYFPATVAVDLARYHSVQTLAELTAAAGFVPDGERLFESTYALTDISKFEGKAFSSLHLIPAVEFEAGLAALRADLASGPVEANLRICALWAVRPGNDAP
jgi:SAM-dependent methyltransferase